MVHLGRKEGISFDKMDIHVVCFQGNPDIAFTSEDELESYLVMNGTYLEKVNVDMEHNPTPNFEVFTIELKQGGYINERRKKHKKAKKDKDNK